MKTISQIKSEAKDARDKVVKKRKEILQRFSDSVDKDKIFFEIEQTLKENYIKGGVFYANVCLSRLYDVRKIYVDILTDDEKKDIDIDQPHQYDCEYYLANSIIRILREYGYRNISLNIMGGNLYLTINQDKK